jgi:tetratricopeptide (TPR) repeat protein
VTDFLDRLQSVLGDRYHLERELGGGGMSRVFLAQETRLTRQVVIKVLPAATAAGLEAGRFEREIQVAASLHHPHIVQLLATGEGDGILWYAMPFVEGESLSERLQRGTIPSLESVRILREVADALAYAHKRGIVHRDIKPANIMLAGRHALVTDFGVAKAIGAAQGGADRPELARDLSITALTSVGMALGTPAYMAPEQAVADPNVDHRADIYSLGVVAYEMLAGSSPYNATTPQAMLAAHVTQPAQPLAARRSDIPQDLADIVMRCLAKSPDDRYANASDLVDALELVGTPSGGTRPFDAKSSAQHRFRRWHPGRVVVMQLLATLVIAALAFGITRALGLPDWIWWAVAAVMLLGLIPLTIASRNERRRAHATMTGIHAAVREGELTGQKAIRGGLIAVGAVLLCAAGFVGAGIAGIGPAATLMSRGRLCNNAGLVLAQFTAPASDSTLSNAILDALRVDLSQSTAIHLLQGPEISNALQRMGLPASTPLTADTAREVAQRANAKAVVTGNVAALGAGYVLTASVIDANTAQPLAQFRETAASDKDLIPAVNRLSKSLRQKIGESLRSIRASEPLEQVTTASLPALRIYSEAEQAFTASDLEHARVLLKQSLVLDSTFAMAWRKLAVTDQTVGDVDGSNVASKAAYRFRDHLPPLERHLTAANYLENVANDRDGAIAEYRQVLQINPDDPAGLNNLALALNEQGKYADAAVLLRHAITTQLQYTFYVNLEFALAGQSRWPAADSLAQEWIRHGGDSSRALTLELLVARQRRDYAALDSLAPKVAHAAGASTGVQELMLSNTARMVETSGQLHRADATYQDLARVGASAGTPQIGLGVELLQAFHAVMQRANPDAAWPMVQQALTTHPLDSLPAADRPYLDIAEIAAMLGRKADVHSFRARWEAVTPAAERDSVEVLTWDGFESLANAQWDRAADEFRQVQAGSHCLPCGAYEWAYALDRGGHPDSAAAVDARIVGSPMTDVLDRFDDPTWYPLTLQHLGEYYQAKGDKTRAIDYLTKFTTVWKSADPDLQPRVKDAKVRIAELQKAGG